MVRVFVLPLLVGSLFAAEPQLPDALVNRVYERLTAAASIPNPPTLVIQRWRPGNPNAGAYLKATANPAPHREIVLDDKLISLCQEMRDQTEPCLAYFLGHELAHFKHDDNWGSHFAKRQLSNAISPAKSVEIETQADRFGGFYASLAGYDALAVAPAALEKFYKVYGIRPNLPGYLPLAERQRLPEVERESLSQWIILFDAGQLLMSLGYYKEAASAFDGLLEQFPSREIFNNAGVAWASLYKADLPWQLDGTTRLPQSESSRGKSTDAAQLFSKAREDFEKSIALDRYYAPAHLNLGLLLKAQGDELERAAAEFKTAERLHGQASVSSAGNALAPDLSASQQILLTKTDLLPDGKTAGAMIPLRLLHAPGIPLPGGQQFYSGSVNGFPILFLSPLEGPDGRKIAGVFISHPPAQWVQRLGEPRNASLFALPARLYPSLGVLLLQRGAWVYEVW